MRGNDYNTAMTETTLRRSRQLKPSRLSQPRLLLALPQSTLRGFAAKAQALRGQSR